MKKNRKHDLIMATLEERSTPKVTCVNCDMVVEGQTGDTTCTGCDKPVCPVCVHDLAIPGGAEPYCPDCCPVCNSDD